MNKKYVNHLNIDKFNLEMNFKILKSNIQGFL